MDKEEKKTLELAAFVIPHVLVLAICMVLMLSGAASPFWNYGFGVDSAGKVYVGENRKISIIENGEKVGSIPTWPGSYYVTVDEQDHVRIITYSKIRVLTLSGNVIEVIEESNSKEYAHISRYWKSVETPSGDVYKVVNSFGWPRIVKNGTETVYRMSALSFAVKCLLGLVSISMFGNGIWLITRWKSIRTR